MSVAVVPIPAEDNYDTGYKSWSHGMTNVSIPEVFMNGRVHILFFILFIYLFILLLGGVRSPSSPPVHTPIHSNKANMKRLLWRPNDIRGPYEPKASWHLSYRWGKTPEKNSPRILAPTGDRTRARCVTDEHATACSTAVGSLHPSV